MKNDLKYALDRGNTTAEKLSEVLQVVQNRDVRIAALEAENAALLEFYNSVPVDVLRMKAGNGFLDMERVDNAVKRVSELLTQAAQ